MADTEALKNDYETFLEDMSKAEKEHDEYLHLYREMTRRQDTSAKTLTHLTYCYKRFRADAKRLDSKKEKAPEEVQMLAAMKSKLAEVSVKLSEMERELPAKDIGPYLSIILGSNLNISLLNPDDRYKYKQEYESFKLTVTYVILGMFTLAYFVPFRAVDALCNFYLCGTTVH